MKILFITKRGPILTGSGTYRDTVLNEMAVRHEVRIFESEADLDDNWDIVHILDIKHLDPKLLWKIKVPVLLEIHDYQWMHFQSFFAVDLPLRFFLQKYRRYKYTRLIENADGVIAHSRYVLDRISHSNKFLVTIGIDTSLFEDPRERPKTNNILMVGRDYFQKGLYTALKALPIILKAVPNATLTVIGKEYFHSKIVAKLLAKGLHVTYIDGISREGLGKYYNEAAVLIHPSELEAFGIVLLEAMASGLPIVASRVGGIPEIIEDDINGLLFDKGDYKGLSERVIGLLTNPQRASGLAEAGKEVVKNRFKIKAMLDDIEKAYLTIGGKGRTL